MRKISDNNLLEDLRSESNASFEVLYKLYFPPVAKYISQNFGTTADAEDVYQETVIVLLQKVRQPDFMLTSSLKTYTFAIARNIWLKRLRDNKLIPVEDCEKYLRESETFTFELKKEPGKDEKIAYWLAKITRNCQRILKAIFFHREPMVSLMQKMGWKNKHTAANQQYKCIQQLKREKQKEML
ncbi:RNA polymerase sigma factor, sigma-70 family [Pedobacter steynii]|uniref:RNA polymerase sigma factor, sigma-70 family n=1 Tax=Pedobacter steynii TaxID=430522 RepID=A0A1H0KDH8_9SPHI|nr:sigma-70 family RNA polymerase sigma factor [Pedobacter steynii]NQX43258.1 sigma-70 family RNA polymerase sigma factor [Pedobacter steynii]SDO53843.1 RNA polymerase sigma factor, sigma-70 family [Pedobacter steynii]